MCAYKRRSPQPVVEGGTSLTTITAHDLIVGNGTGTPNLVAPSATSGVPLISQGAAADPAYGTAVVAGGGTGVTSTTAYAVICGGTTSTNPLQSIAGVGSSGQVLTSNGAGALPTFQTTSAVTGSVIGTPRSVLSNTTTDRYLELYSASGSGTIGQHQSVMPLAGTIDRLYVNIDTNASTASVTVAVNKNGSNSAVTTSVTSSTTGVFSDLTHSVSVAQGDLVSFFIAQSTTGTITGNITCRFIPS